ncbi:MAG: DUF805 domain-containing protein [Clostridia bacterium]|nr:DUF805 domain-containing protein [Clostridia bacterium]
MIKAYFEMFERDREFSTRQTKEDFWRSACIDIIIWSALAILAIIFKDIIIFWGAVAILYLLVTFSARLALWFRRMHDTGIRGTFSLAILIPVLGVLALLFIFMSDSQPKNNVYGEYVKPPKKKKK